ncbi:MAG: hypothetical protein P8X46_11385 [Nitrospirales bacterium]
MSKLIEALNRLQSGRADDYNSPSSSSLMGPPPGASKPVPPHQTDSKPSSKKKSSTEEPPLFNLPLHDWLSILQNEYLASFVREGGGAVKVAVFPHEEALKTCQQELDGLAKRETYVMAKVDARFTKAHMVEKLFQKIAKQVDWDELAASNSRKPKRILFAADCDLE